MIQGALARRYARALLELAASPAQRDKFARDVANLAEVLHQTDEAGTPLLSILTSKRFTLSNREDLVLALSRRVMADPIVQRFLVHVLRKQRIAGFSDIARAYQTLADEAAHRIQARITSAAPLTPQAVRQIKEALERATELEVITVTDVDPELIGGIVTRVGSYVIDGSVRSTLAQLRNALRG